MCCSAYTKRCVCHPCMRQSPHAQRLSSHLDGAPPARGAACCLAPRDGSMPLRRHDGQGMSVLSRLPHPSTAEPSSLPTDPQGDVSPCTAGPEGCTACLQLAEA